MWSLGITATFIATQQNAVHARTFDTLFRKAKNGEVSTLTDFKFAFSNRLCAVAMGIALGLQK